MYALLKTPTSDSALRAGEVYNITDRDDDLVELAWSDEWYDTRHDRIHVFTDEEIRASLKAIAALGNVIIEPDGAAD